MKTVKEWYETLKEPYASEAIRQVSSSSLNNKKGTLRDCFSGYLDASYKIENTSWYDVYSNLEKYIKTDKHYRHYLKNGAKVKNTPKLL